MEEAAMAETSILSVRVSEEEREIIAAAAEKACTSLSDFVRRKAVEAAEIEIMERRLVTIPAKDWTKFESWTKAPARRIAGLRDLAASRPPWRD